MKNKNLLPYTLYGLGVCVSLCFAAVSDSTWIIVGSTIFTAFFAYRLFKTV